MPAKSLNYIDFLFNPDGSLKSRSTAPVINYVPQTDSFVLKYSIPGYHMPRQYFKFSSVPEQFPNQFVSEIFRIFSITDSFLFRHPHNKIPSFKRSIINPYFGIENKHEPDPDEIEAASYNLKLAIKLGRLHHSLFFFDSYLEAYKVLHPELRYTKNVVKRIQTEFNKLISN